MKSYAVVFDISQQTLSALGPATGVRMPVSRRKMTLITLGVILFATIGALLAAAIATHRQYHASLTSAAGYLQDCLSIQSRPSLRGFENTLQGTTTRTVISNSDGTYVVMHDWTVLGLVETRRRLYIKVLGDPDDDPTLQSFSRDPI